MLRGEAPLQSTADAGPHDEESKLHEAAAAAGGGK